MGVTVGHGRLDSKRKMKGSCTADGEALAARRCWRQAQDKGQRSAMHRCSHGSGESTLAPMLAATRLKPLGPSETRQGYRGSR
eukprot:65785-Amphidinium_carterae.2